MSPFSLVKSLQRSFNYHPSRTSNKIYLQGKLNKGIKEQKSILCHSQAIVGVILLKLYYVKKSSLRDHILLS